MIKSKLDERQRKKRLSRLINHTEAVLERGETAMCLLTDFSLPSDVTLLLVTVSKRINQAVRASSLGGMLTIYIDDGDPNGRTVTMIGLNK